jgi:threonine dehydrogenase-like Zn-dependent dehydrogenase
MGSFNGVPVRGIHLFDSTDTFPAYEAPLLSAVRGTVQSGDTVVVIGGGRGVSTVVAAQRAGPSGDVIAYEAGEERVAMATETVELSNMEDTARIEHAVVGDDVEIVGDLGDPDYILPTAVPDADVLVLDCEGAELGILSAIEQEPRAIIVETHGFLDAPEAAVREILADTGYEVVERGVEDDSLGTYILTATPT